MLDAGRARFCAASRRHGASARQRDRLWDAISGQRPSEQAVAAELRYVRHLAGRIASDNGVEAELRGAISEALSGNADYANLQTIPGIGPRTAAQLVVSVDIADFGEPGQARQLLRAGALHPAVRRLRRLREGLPGRQQGAQEPARVLVQLAGQVRTTATAGT